MSSSASKIRVAARRSPLSQAQVEEVWEELKQFHPESVFELLLLDTTGDLDQQTSLRDLGKTDFFTQEIDSALLQGECAVAIHSAKDLPEPLMPGLTVVALTRGVDPSDVLVMRAGDTLAELPKGAKIGTSSLRRGENMEVLRADLVCVDIRGPTHKRLALLDECKVDGVVVAEAALIRLKLTHLNRVRVPGPVAPLQGQLAVVTRENDVEMAQLFAPLDTRR